MYSILFAVVFVANVCSFNIENTTLLIKQRSIDMTLSSGDIHESYREYLGLSILQSKRLIIKAEKHAYPVKSGGDILMRLKSSVTFKIEADRIYLDIDYISDNYPGHRVAVTVLTNDHRCFISVFFLHAIVRPPLKQIITQSIDMAASFDQIVRDYRDMIIQQKILTEKMENQLDLMIQENTRLRNLTEEDTDDKYERSSIDTVHEVIDKQKIETPIVSLQDTINRETEKASFNWQGTIDFVQMSKDWLVVAKGKATPASGKISPFTMPILGRLVIKDYKDMKATVTMNFDCTHKSLFSVSKTEYITAGFNAKLVITDKNSLIVDSMKITYKTPRVIKRFESVFQGQFRYVNDTIEIILQSI